MDRTTTMEKDRTAAARALQEAAAHALWASDRNQPPRGMEAVHAAQQRLQEIDQKIAARTATRPRMTAK